MKKALTIIFIIVILVGIGYFWDHDRGAMPEINKIETELNIPQNDTNSDTTKHSSISPKLPKLNNYELKDKPVSVSKNKRELAYQTACAFLDKLDLEYSKREYEISEEANYITIRYKAPNGMLAGDFIVVVDSETFKISDKTKLWR